jgi:XTP/dITP diphosphohydrolase
LVLATANPEKAAEMAAILREELDDLVELVDRPAGAPVVEETGTTLEENARLKAFALDLEPGQGALAEDTGLEVLALGGAPGVRSARFSGEHATYAENVAKLLCVLEGETDRRATFRTVAVCRFPGGAEIVAEGVVEGEITRAPRGGSGFGYDPVFAPAEGDGRTFAEMSAAEKHDLSHRGRALRSVAARLREQL